MDGGLARRVGDQKCGDDRRRARQKQRLLHAPDQGGPASRHGPLARIRPRRHLFRGAGNAGRRLHLGPVVAGA